MATLPPITDMDTVLAVFMHESLPSPPNENIGDPKRLVHLGERVLEQAVAYHYFMKRPILPAEEVEVPAIVPFFSDSPESPSRHLSKIPLGISTICYININSLIEYELLLDTILILQRYVYVNQCKPRFISSRKQNYFSANIWVPHFYNMAWVRFRSGSRRL
jgi:hypothetical protein